MTTQPFDETLPLAARYLPTKRGSAGFFGGGLFREAFVALAGAALFPAAGRLAGTVRLAAIVHLPVILLLQKYNWP